MQSIVINLCGATRGDATYKTQFEVAAGCGQCQRLLKRHNTLTCNYAGSSSDEKSKKTESHESQTHSPDKQEE